MTGELVLLLCGALPPVGVALCVVAGWLLDRSYGCADWLD